MSTLQNERWLFPSHESIYEGVIKDLGFGEHASFSNVPLHMGRIVINNTSELSGIDRTHNGVLSMLVTESALYATLSGVRQPGGGIKKLAGIVMPTGRAGEIIELQNPTGADLPVGYQIELSRGRPYSASALMDNGDAVELGEPNYELARNFISVIDTVLKRHAVN